MKRNGYYDVDGKFYSKDKKDRQINPLAPRGPRHFHSHYFEGISAGVTKNRSVKRADDNCVTKNENGGINSRTRRQLVILTVAFVTFIIVYIVIMTAISFMGLLW